MSRARAASDEERRRIAATLHDGVVQQLVAASFMAAGQAQHAASDGDPGRAESLRSVAATVRDSVAGLRSLLVDIYPPSLRDSGLASALHDLVRGASGHGAAVVADIGAQAAAAVPEPQREVMFRIAHKGVPAPVAPIPRAARAAPTTPCSRPGGSARTSAPGPWSCTRR
jgi:two-component system NarL family sensor kinase